MLEIKRGITLEFRVFRSTIFLLFGQDIIRPCISFPVLLCPITRNLTNTNVLSRSSVGQKPDTSLIGLKSRHSFWRLKGRIHFLASRGGPHALVRGPHLQRGQSCISEVLFLFMSFSLIKARKGFLFFSSSSFLFLRLEVVSLGPPGSSRIISPPPVFVSLIPSARCLRHVREAYSEAVGVACGHFLGSLFCLLQTVTFKKES